MDSYASIPDNAPEEVLNSCVTLLRAQAKMVVEYKKDDITSEKERMKLIPDFWKSVELLKYPPSEAVKMIFKDNITPTCGDLC